MSVLLDIITKFKKTINLFEHLFAIFENMSYNRIKAIHQGKADALPRFFGQADGIIFKQAVRIELCGVALKQPPGRRKPEIYKNGISKG